MTERDEPLVLINLFSMPPEKVDQFVADWESSTAASKDVKGFRGTRLHRCIDPDAEYPLVNVARWDSVEDWQTAIDKFFSAPRSDHEEGGRSWVSANPNLYTVVSVIDDPQADA
jgi:heme-degrading monooxygenase HmoA